MIILHGSWVPENSNSYLDGSFVLWGENSPRYEGWEESLFSKRFTRKRCHPFAAAAHAVLASWPFFLQHSSSADALDIYKSLENMRWIWLPTDKWGPFASPQLYSRLQQNRIDEQVDQVYGLDSLTANFQGIHSPEDALVDELPLRNPDNRRLKPWRVPVAELSAWGALKFLLHIDPRQRVHMIDEEFTDPVIRPGLYTGEQTDKLWKRYLRKQRNSQMNSNRAQHRRVRGSKKLEWLGLDELEDGFAWLDNVLLGDDLFFWRRLALMVQELITRQEYLPGLQIWNLHKDKNDYIDSPGMLFPHWMPVLQRRNLQQTLIESAAGMPHLSRAIDPERETNNERVPRKPIAMNSGLLIHSFIISTVNEGVHYLSPSPVQRASDKQSPDRQWINTLLSEEISVTESSKPKHMERFEDLRFWAWNAISSTYSRLRLCFRLEYDPAVDGEYSWKLVICLQDETDLSLQIPASFIWSAEGLRMVNQQQDVQNHFLAQLGSAARIYPPLYRAMQTPCPEEAFLTAEEAYDFMQNAAAELETIGFRVMFPAYLSGLSLKLKIRSPRHGKGPSGGVTDKLSLDTMLDFDWQLAIGDQLLGEEEFQQLVSLKQPLVQMRGQWIEVKAEEIEALQGLWKRKQKGQQISLLDILRSGIIPSESVGASMVESKNAEIMGLPVSHLEVEGWLQKTLEHLQDRKQLQMFSVPRDFHGQLRPYQLRGFSWLRFITDLGLGACLADDMGLGKTIQCLAFLLSLHEDRQAAGPVLLICPTSVVGNWQREADRFAPGLRSIVHHGPSRLTGEDFIREAGKTQLLISSYSLLSRDYELFKQIAWQGIILDEAQNIKNPETIQARTVKSLDSHFRIAMTGTPIENRLQELWSIMDFLNPGYLGNMNSFNKKFAVPIEKYHDQESSQKLSRTVVPFILRRKKSDPGIAPELPEKLEDKTYCSLIKEQATLYEAVVQDSMTRLENLEGMERRGVVLATLLKLKQLCNHPALLLKDHSPLPGRSGKLNRLEEMLEEITSRGEKALIFTQYAEWGTLLRDYLQKKLGQEVFWLHGGTPRMAREQMIQRFQEDEQPAIFILSVKAGGVGINLTRANHVFHYDRWWNPAVEEQATDRAYRIGQNRNVEVHKFVCAGTLEEKIDELIEKKRALGSEIIGNGEDQLTELSTDELRKMLSLNWNEVGEE